MFVVLNRYEDITVCLKLNLSDRMKRLCQIEKKKYLPL